MTVVMTVESQPNWFVRIWVNIPAALGSQVMLLKFVVLLGDNVVVVITRESQPSLPLNSIWVTPT